MMAKKEKKSEKNGNVNAALASLVVPIGSLRLDERNARVHGERSLAAIRTSLAEFGQQKPVVALNDGTVIAGNGTLQAAIQLSWDGIAVVRFDDEEKARAFALADNRASELSTWDVDVLLGELSSGNGSMDSWFSPDDVQDMIDYKQNPFTTTRVSIDELKPHPRNYRQHPDDQLEHIIRSIEAHGFYRNIVVARDGTILTGHGVVQAARKMGKKRIPVIRLDISPDEPRAIKVLTSDNEIGNLAETDDRALTELLREIVGTDEGLIGTGFSEQQLAALTFVTRPASEIGTIDEASEWVGMPEYVPNTPVFKVIVNCDSVEDREAFLKFVNAEVRYAKLGTISIWWPEKQRADLSSLKFTDAPRGDKSDV